MDRLKPRSLFAVEDDGLIQRLHFHSDSENEEMQDTTEDLNSSTEDFPVKCSPIFRNSSDEERMNSSTDSAIGSTLISSTVLRPALKKRLATNVRSSKVDTTPPYRKVRALRLFGSPQSPKTLLKQSELTATTESTRVQSRILTPKQKYDKNHNERLRTSNLCKTSPRSEPNINPFNHYELYPFSQGKRRRDSGICRTSFNDSLEKFYDSELENEIHPTKRMFIRDKGRYETEFLETNPIGSGEFGSVFRCINRLDGCAYAIKKSRKPLKGTSDERTALNEVYAHAVLGQHKHVVQYFSAWAENDHMLIQNEFCNGGSLAQAIEDKRHQRLHFCESDVKQILLHIASGLRYIHSLNLAHMDIKPGNIFITRKQRNIPISPNSSDDGFEDDFIDDEFTYKIGDLGHVTSLSNPEVEEGDCRYMPYELLQDDYTHLPKADIFALGLTMYEVCGGGTLPKNGDEWHSIRNGNTAYLPHYSQELNALIKLMIHPNPDVRPSSAALVQNQTLVPYVCKTKEQIFKELNAEKFKVKLLSRQLQLERGSKSNRLSRIIGKKVNRSSSVTNF